jgi:hypothetical protein
MDSSTSVQRLLELRAQGDTDRAAAWAVRIEPDDGLPRIVKFQRSEDGGTRTIVVDTGRDRWLLLAEDFDAASGG